MIEREMGDSKGTVCVTGAVGFVASWLIKRLLESGYTVRGTIRQSDYRDLPYLTNLPGAPGRLQFVEADLNSPESFESAVEGCIGAFHTAHPIGVIEAKEPEDVVTKRAVGGTLGILKACLKSQTVRRVIYTGSTAAVVANDEPEDVVDETSWSDVDFIRGCDTPVASYMISKIFTEKTAKDFGDKNGLEVVTVLPSLISGPFICPRLPASVDIAMAMIFGKTEFYPWLLRTDMVHVDDLASAHIFLFQHPEAKGRYICSQKNVTIDEMAKFLSSKYPEFAIPSQKALKEVEGFKYKGVSSKKLLDAGFEFKHDLNRMYDDAIKSCKERGIL